MAIIGPVSMPEFGLSYCAPDVSLKIGANCIGNGKVIISKDWLGWQPNDVSDGILFSWKNISVHGISSLPSKCIYFMLDQQIIWPGIYDPTGINANGYRENHNDDVESDDESENNFKDAQDEVTTECWLLPSDHNTIETIYRAMNDCQALNADVSDNEMNFSDSDNEKQTLNKPYCVTPTRYSTPDSDRISDDINNLCLDDDPNCFADAD